MARPIGSRPGGRSPRPLASTPRRRDGAGGAILLDHGRLARKHVEELVLLFTRPPLRASAGGRSATLVGAYGRGRRTGSTRPGRKGAATRRRRTPAHLPRPR